MPLLDFPKAPPGSTRETAICITDLNNSTKQLVEETFGHFWVRGEITDFKRHRNGHWYFSLRDKTSQISCVMWSSDQRRMPASPDDGMQIVPRPRTVFPGRGALQMRVYGLRLKRRLEKGIARLSSDFADGLLEKDEAPASTTRGASLLGTAHGAACATSFRWHSPASGIEIIVRARGSGRQRTNGFARRSRECFMDGST